MTGDFVANPDNKLVTVVRIIEYNGTKEWIEATANASRVPFTGEVRLSPENGKPLPEGCFIRSGVVEWGVKDSIGEQPRQVIPIPPGNPV
jgi:hypothetical protein